MSVQPTLVKKYKFSYAPHAATEPEYDDNAWVEVKDTFKNLANFFPKGENIDITTIDSEIRESMEGLPGGEEYILPGYFTDGLAAMHTQMTTDRIDADKGFSWVKIELPNRNQYVVGKFTTTKQLPTPEVEAGSPDEIEVTLYSQGHVIKAIPTT